MATFLQHSNSIRDDHRNLFSVRLGEYHSPVQRMTATPTSWSATTGNMELLNLTALRLAESFDKRRVRDRASFHRRHRRAQHRSGHQNNALVRFVPPSTYVSNRWSLRGFGLHFAQYYLELQLPFLWWKGLQAGRACITT